MKRIEPRRHEGTKSKLHHRGAEERPFSIRSIDPRGEEWQYTDDDGTLDFGRGYCSPPPDVLYVTDFNALANGSAVSPERILQVLIRVQHKFEGADLCVHHLSLAMPLLRTMEQAGAISFAAPREGHQDWYLVRLGWPPDQPPPGN